MGGGDSFLRTVLLCFLLVQLQIIHFQDKELFQDYDVVTPMFQAGVIISVIVDGRIPAPLQFGHKLTVSLIHQTARSSLAPCHLKQNFKQSVWNMCPFVELLSTS